MQKELIKTHFESEAAMRGAMPAIANHVATIAEKKTTENGVEIYQAQIEHRVISWNAEPIRAGVDSD